MSDKPKETKLEYTETIIPIKFSDPCKHYFEFIDGECRCRGCKMGLIGVVDVKDGRPI